MNLNIKHPILSIVLIFVCTVLAFAGQAPNAVFASDIKIQTAQEPTGFWTDPSRLDFVGYEGSTEPLKQALDIFDYAGLGIEWTAIEDIPWLALSHTSGSTPSHIFAEVNTTGMAAGQYLGRIDFTQPGQPPDGSSWIEVTLEIRQASSFDIAPKALNFEAYAGQPATAIKLLDIGKIGAYELEWRLYEDIPWLHIGPQTDQPQPDGDHFWFPRGYAPAALQAWASPALLAPGKYTGEILIVSDNAQNSPQTVPVTLVVKQASQTDPQIRVMAKNTETGHINLTWTAVNNPQVAAYRVFRGRQGSADYWFVNSSQANSSQALTYTDRSITLRPYTEYCYYVAASNPNGTSFITDSSPVCIKTGSLMPPPIDLEP